MSCVLIIGSGISGLTAALALRQQGYFVTVFEVGPQAGGLASGVSFAGHDFDGGPYIVLDRPGLEWAFAKMNQDLAALVPMQKIEKIYRVRASDSSKPLEFHSDLNLTSKGFDQFEAGAGRKYQTYVAQMRQRYQRLTPVQRQTHPAAAVTWADRFKFLKTAVTQKLWRDVGFLRGSLLEVLSDVPEFLWPGIAIWTRIAGQKFSTAPAPMGLIPAIFHYEGCFLPSGGMRTVPEVLLGLCKKAGVEFQFGALVEKIEVAGGRATGVTLADGNFVPGDAVFSTINGVATRLVLRDEKGPAAEALAQLPLQSPGFCVYLLCRGKRPDFYLNFRTDIEATKVFVSPESVTGEGGEEWPARLIQPLVHESNEETDLYLQTQLKDRLLNEKWWQEGVTSFRVVGFRTTRGWGEDFHLYRDSMNPAMTAQFMRQGRLPYVVPGVSGLFQSGSSTHPGQWVSFAAISGILAAQTCADFLAARGRGGTGRAALKGEIS